MDLFLTYSLFLGCKIHLQVFSSCHKSQKVFSIYLLKKNLHISSVQFSSVAQPCPALRDPMNHSMPGLPVHHQLTEFTQLMSIK